MKVKIKAFATFRNIIGKERLLDIKEGSGVKELLEGLCSSYGELRNLVFDDSELKDDVNILINGKNIQTLNGIQTKLEDGDEVALFSAAIGG
ncbi:MAG: MoaD family protein [Methanotrichaceae archaeon]|nr:MoaD family protein [Methanotrichaceae archaeon]